MTVLDAIRLADGIKENAFADEIKTAWLNEAEGLVQTEVMLLAIEDVISYAWAEDQGTELLVRPPHDKLYWTYLTAMLDFANGEYNRYQNTMQLFNNYFGEYMRWFAERYRPADGEDVQGWPGYYISAYGIAVKHGFSGTEEEWLESLKGEPGGGGSGGGMTDTEVREAIENALSEAKASGEFDGQDGEDGVSPTVTVSKVGKVTTITITDVNGTKTATIKDGEDGSSSGDGTGTDGEDGIGIASIVQTTKSTEDDGINVMTITLTDGSVHTFEVQNGSKGSKGDDGYTPVKGTDYFDGEDGADGVSCTHYWSGTTLHVTSASGTSSADLQGEPGADGKDYVLTDADKTEIAEEAAALVDTQLLSIIGEVS